MTTSFSPKLSGEGAAEPGNSLDFGKLCCPRVYGEQKKETAMAAGELAPGGLVLLRCRVFWSGVRLAATLGGILGCEAADAVKQGVHR